MPDTSKWDADPSKQAAFLEDFKQTAATELAAIRRRLILLLMPTFIILIAVLGLTLLTWIEISQLKNETISSMRAVEKRIEHFRVAQPPLSVEPGKNTLENVKRFEIGRTLGKKIKLGVTRTGERVHPVTKEIEKHDDVGRLLKELGAGYKDFDNLEINDLVKTKKIFDYDVVFLTCNTGGEDELKGVLKDYVMAGGILYASDLRFAAIQKAFPDEIAQSLVGQGQPQELEADIVDEGLRDYLSVDPEMGKHLKNGKMPLKFDRGAWRPAAFGSPRTKILLQGKYKKLTGPGQPDEGFASAPLLAKFQIGKGTVIFTSFHNEKQNSAIEKKLLEYLVFSLVTAGVDADINAKLDQSGFAPQRSNLHGTPKSNPEITKEYKNEKVADLRFALGFRDGDGAKLRFNLKSPDGKEYTLERASSVILEVTGAKAGAWTYTVTALNLPYENFPFMLTVGAKK